MLTWARDLRDPPAANSATTNEDDYLDLRGKLRRRLVGQDQAIDLIAPYVSVGR